MNSKYYFKKKSFLFSFFAIWSLCLVIAYAEQKDRNAEKKADTGSIQRENVFEVLVRISTDDETLEYLIKNRSEKGVIRNILMECYFLGRVEVVRRAIGLGFTLDPNLVAFSGEKIDSLETLRGKKMPVYHGNTLFHSAVIGGQYETLCFLIALYPEFFSAERGKHLFRLAVSRGNFEMALLLATHKFPTVFKSEFSDPFEEIAQKASLRQIHGFTGVLALSQKRWKSDSVVSAGLCSNHIGVRKYFLAKASEKHLELALQKADQKGDLELVDFLYKAKAQIGR